MPVWGADRFQKYFSEEFGLPVGLVAEYSHVADMCTSRFFVNKKAASMVNT